MADDINYEFLKSVYERENKKPAPRPPARRAGRTKKIRWGLITFMLGAVTFAILLGFTVAIFSRFMLIETILALAPADRLIPKTNILVLGLDKTGTIHRSDTIMVINFNPQSNEANIVSIPRDTLVSIPGHKMDKFNHAYAFGGPELARQTAENFLNIKIPYFIVVDTSGLANMIDDLGGIKIDVEKSMFYVDYAQNLFINLKPGMQILSGRDCLSYLRYRHDADGDFGRIFRQQKFMKALIHQILDGQNLFKSPQLLVKLSSYVETNLDNREVLGFILSIRKVWEYGQIKMDSLTGRPVVLEGVFYLEPDPMDIRQITNKFFRVTL